jgi:hypothetical protein
MLLYSSLKNVKHCKQASRPYKSKNNSVVLSPQANYNDRAAATCLQNQCQLLFVDRCCVVSATGPHCR